MARIRRGIVGAMAFTDLAGEEKATRIFQESLRRERLAHAYLITSASTSSAEKFALQIAKTEEQRPNLARTSRFYRR